MTTSLPQDLQGFHIGFNMEEYHKKRCRKGTGLTTGFAKLDEAISYLPGLTIVQGDTGIGKSAFIENIILNNAEKGVPVLLFDRELGLTTTRSRFISILSRIPKKVIEAENFINNERTEFNKALNILTNLPIFYYYDIGPELIQEAIKKVGNYYKKPLLLVVDSLHAFASGGDNELQSLTRWINFFNEIKVKYDGLLSVIILCEKAKRSYNGAGGDAKGCGAIDYRSELTLDLGRKADTDLIYINGTKVRDGKRGILSVVAPVEPFCFLLQERQYFEPA